jgi:hypothetical protein
LKFLRDLRKQISRLLLSMNALVAMKNATLKRALATAILTMLPSMSLSRLATSPTPTI